MPWHSHRKFEFCGESLGGLLVLLWAIMFIIAIIRWLCDLF